MSKTSGFRSQIFYVPNLISLFRIGLLIPIGYFLWKNNLLFFGILASLAFLSDFLDGILARRLNQISDLGKILDPLADKLSIGMAMVILFLKEIVPTWLMLLVVGRDVAILIAGLIFSGKYKQVTPSNFIGKVTANVLAFMVVSYIFDIQILQKIFTPLAVFFVILSSASYAYRYYRELQQAKQQSA